MDAQTLINQALTYYDNVDPASPDNTTRRNRLLLYLQHIYEFVWNWRSWEWTFKETAFVFPIGTNAFALATLDPLFLEFSRGGGLFNSDTRIRMREKSRSVVERMRQEIASSGFMDPIFAIWGGSIQLPYTLTSDANFTAHYRFRAETLIDDPTPMQMPDRYASTVILPGLVARTQEAKQDQREIWNAQFKDGLSQMMALENPIKTSTQRLPLANRGW